MKKGLIPLCLLLAACARPPIPAPELIDDPLFRRVGWDSSASWRMLQHAGPDSYRAQASQGVLRIERFGPEPWGKVVQTVAVGEFTGRTLEWSGEIRASLRMPAERFVTPSGLFLVLIGRAPDSPIILGESVLKNITGEPELAAGDHPWISQRVRVTIPEGASRMEVGLILGHEGWIELKNPRLRVLP